MKAAFGRLFYVCHSDGFTITSLARTPAEALSAFLARAGRFRHLSLTICLKTSPHHFDAVAWLCMKVNSGPFRADVVTRGSFPAQNSLDNGERVRSLLCDREALGKPPGAAGISPKGSDLTRSGAVVPGGCRAEPDQGDLACRRYSKDTSCPAVLWRRRSWLWSQNISCPHQFMQKT